VAAGDAAATVASPPHAGPQPFDTALAISQPAAQARPCATDISRGGSARACACRALRASIERCSFATRSRCRAGGSALAPTAAASS
jgi:hypothetical protein